MADDLELPPLARRRKERRRTLFRGVLVFSEGKYVGNCTIRDLSETGARILLPAGQILPEQIYLINIRNSMAHRSQVRWYNGTEAGLEFLNALDLRTLSDPALAYLQRIWATRN